MKCKVCGAKTVPAIYKGIQLEAVTFDVCSWKCLVKSLKALPVAEWERSKSFKNGNIRPFASSLEELVYWRLAKEIKIEYEPFTLCLTGKKYIPDFYFPEKNIFLEIKGCRNRLWKAKLFAKEFPVYVLSAKQIQLFEKEVKNNGPDQAQRDSNFYDGELCFWDELCRQQITEEENKINKKTFRNSLVCSKRSSYRIRKNCRSD